MIKRLFIPDVHFPSHDATAYGLMFQVAQDFKPDEIVILGDFFDCYSVSRYDKHPKKMFLELRDELELGIKALEKISGVLKPRKIWFLEGNHEARVRKYLANNAPLLLGNFQTPQDVFELPKNTTYVPYGQDGFIDFDGLYAMHGVITGKNPAMKALERYGRSVIFGHTHRLQEAHKKVLDGPVLRAFNCGWLGDIREAAEYVQDTADWTQGFATGFFPKSGNWTITLHTILNREVTVNGKHYSRSPDKSSR
jgi:UDP-2,3-diacylglucosamine pyrophosphatase LpxH